MAGGSENLASAAGGWSARHRRKAIAGWLAFVTIAFAVGIVVGQRPLTDVEMSNGESKQATAVYQKAFPYHSGEQVLVQGRGSVRSDDPAFTAAVRDLVRRLNAIRTVDQVRSPLDAAGRPLRSADGRSMLVTFNVAGDSTRSQHNVEAALAASAATGRAHPQVRVEEFGTASANKALTAAYLSDAHKAEYTSIPVTLIILVFAFGSVVAAGVPLLLGITAVLAALGLIAPLSHLIPVNPGQIDAVVALIGLAVGVDYSMFYLRRKLEERRRGLSSERALARAVATSGQAVLVSGLTVMTAMAGMFLAGNAVFSALAMGTVVVVAVAVLGSVTVLPAVLAAPGRQRREGARAVRRAPARARPLPSLDLGDRPCAPSPRRVTRGLDRAADRARRAGAQHAHGRSGHGRAPTQPPDHGDLRADAAGVSGWSHSGRSRGAGQGGRGRSARGRGD
jgi:uncharacterized membrane protein YdfJ with MMPL/SSD domain